MKIIGILGLVTIISITQGTYFTEQNITSGITFIKESNGSISYQKWTALYYYSIKGYLDQTILFENAIEKLQKACSLIKGEYIICTTVIIVRLEKYREKIEHSRDLINRFRTEGRYKRSLFPAAGMLLSTLFGLMDEGQANTYNNIINELENNMKTQKELQKAQLSVFKDSLISNDNRLRELTDKIISLNRNAEKLNQKFNNESMENQNLKNFNFLLQTATLIMIEHNRVSDIINDLLTGSSLHKITALLPAERLVEDLKLISYSLDNDKHLPIDIDKENIYELFRIISVKTTIINNRLLIIITIPIVNTNTYEVIRAIPIPTRINNEAVIMQPSTEYFLINRKAQQFIPITAEEHANCARKTNEHIICSTSSPIYIGRHTRCEVSLFNEVDLQDLNVHCKYNIKKIQQRNYFVKLGSPNLFYVYINKPIVVRFLCDGREPTEILINQNGMIQIDDKCIMYSEGIMIEAFSETGFESKYLLESPEFNISELDSLKFISKTEMNKSVTDETEKDVTLLENYNTEFDDLQKRVEQIQEMERTIVFNEKKYPVPSDFGNGISWFKIIYFSIIALILFILINKIISFCYYMLRSQP